MGISTHVLDTAAGKPAAGIPVTLERRGASGAWTLVAAADTDQDGRASGLVSDADTRAGHYRLTLEMGDHFCEGEATAFFPFIQLSFVVTDAAEHYHVPVLVSPFGYTTYRGS